MLKKLMVLTVLLVGAAFAVTGVMHVPPGMEAVPYGSGVYGGGQALVPTGVQSSVASSLLVEGQTAGVTTYDYQQNGAMGNRVAIDKDGNAHVCWMHSLDEDIEFPNRDIFYNFWEKASSSFAWPTGIKASGATRAGYTTMGVLPDGRAVVAFHEGTSTATMRSAVAVDASQGFGVFSSPVAVDTAIPVIWPHVVVGSDGKIHVAGHVSDTGAPGDTVYYSRSTDGGLTFSPWFAVTGDGGNDPAIAVSKDGGRVAIAWTSQVPINTGGNDFACGHVYYIESTNGGASWGSPQKITQDRYAEEIEESESLMFLFANSRDLDCAYDETGKLHILYIEGWHQWNAGAYYYPRMWGRPMYWNAANGFGCPTANHPMFHALDENGDTLWELDSLGMWGVASPVSEEHGGAYGPQLALWGTKIVATWGGQWDSLDLSAGGTVNGDLWASFSSDNGKTWKMVADHRGLTSDKDRIWAHVTNITNTRTPGAGIDACADEDYHTVWPWVGTDNLLHITYIKDLFAGSVISSDQCPSYAVFTESPAKYLRFTIRTDGKIIDTSAVAETPPEGLASIEIVGQRPFSNSVTFRIIAPNTHASLKVYDASGTLVETVFEGVISDNRMLTWNTKDIAAGVYFYSFVTQKNTSNGKLVIVH